MALHLTGRGKRVPEASVVTPVTKRRQQETETPVKQSKSSEQVAACKVKPSASEQIAGLACKVLQPPAGAPSEDANADLALPGPPGMPPQAPPEGSDGLPSSDRMAEAVARADLDIKSRSDLDLARQARDYLRSRLHNLKNRSDGAGAVAEADDLEHKVIPSLTAKIEIATRNFKRQRAEKFNHKNLLLFESMDKMACNMRDMADKLQKKAATGKESSCIMAACLESDGDHDGEADTSADAVEERVQQIKTERLLESSEVAASVPVLHGSKKWYEDIVSGRAGVITRVSSVRLRRTFVGKAVNHVRVSFNMKKDKASSTVMAVETIEEIAPSADNPRPQIRITLGECV